MKKVRILLLYLWAFTGFAQNTALFEQGNVAYKNENYQDAINNWKQILEQDEHSAALYYNLGNAHYKMNNIGPSIYYYEKALQLSPNDQDILNNLNFARNARIDSIDPLPQSIFTKWYQQMAGILSFNGWAIAAVVCSLLLMVFFLWYYFSFSERKKRVFFSASVIAVFLLITSLVLAFKTYSDLRKDRPAIIFAERVEVRNEPSLGGEPAFLIHEGTKVQILTEDQDWVRIQLVNGKDGWIPATELKAL